jgi:endonuclease III
LVYIIMSNKTSPRMARSVYRQLKKAYRTWDRMLAAPISEVRRILLPAGLAGVKSRQLRAAMRAIRRDWGTCDLRPLRRLPTGEAEEYLVSLDGVSEKVAKCVLMYTVGRDVLPVDGHVHRLATRLGWTRRKRADQCHAELEAVVPAHRRHAFHVDAVAHGRLLCRPTQPLCAECCINQYCERYRMNGGP